MKVGLISDTHDNLSMVERALLLFEREGVEAVIHAGDWVAPFTARKFQDFSGRLYGSYGNNDGEIIGLSRAFREMDMLVKGEFTEFDLDGEKAVVIHGVYPPVLRAIVRSGEFPTIITGHTHIPLIEKQGDVLLVNPGEACGYLYGRCTVGILDTHEKAVEIYDLV
jgi:putative phosphoesterase